MRRLLPILLLLAACSPPDDDDPNVDMGVIDTDYEPGCEGGLVDVDGECVAMTNALEVLLFGSDQPTAQVCSRTYTSDDPGIEQAIVAEDGPCRVFDVEQYGPLNFEPADRESGVSMSRGAASIQVDEADLFESCVERRTLPEGFVAFGANYTVSFGGSDVVPEFAAEITLATDPGFSRTALEDGAPVKFTWTPTVANEVQVFLSTQNINIVCQASAGLGELEVPADFVAMLPEPEPPREEAFTSIRLRNRVTLVFAEDDAAVTLTADTYQSNF